MRSRLSDVMKDPNSLRKAGELIEPATPRIALIFKLWYDLRGTCDLPSPTDMTPVRMKHVLPDVHVYNVNPNEPRYVVRLIGSRISAHQGLAVTGMAISEIASPDLRRSVTNGIEAAIAAREPVHVHLPRSIVIPEVGLHDIESLWMPFATDGEIIDRIIAISIITDHIR